MLRSKNEQILAGLVAVSMALMLGISVIGCSDDDFEGTAPGAIVVVERMPIVVEDDDTLVVAIAASVYRSSIAPTTLAQFVSMTADNRIAFGMTELSDNDAVGGLYDPSPVPVWGTLISEPLAVGEMVTFLVVLSTGSETRFMSVPFFEAEGRLMALVEWTQMSKVDDLE